MKINVRNAETFEGEPDPDFVASAREAFRSEKVQNTIKRLGKQFDPKRTYKTAIKVS